MSNTQSQMIESVNEVGPQLNSVAKQAAICVRAVEKLLCTEYGIGISVRIGASTAKDVKVDMDSDGITQSSSVNRNLILSYEPRGTNMRMTVVRTVTDSWDQLVEPEEIVLWAGATLDEKLKTFLVLPDLVVAIAKQAAETSKAVEETTKKVSEGLAGLTQKHLDAAASEVENERLAGLRPVGF